MPYSIVIKNGDTKYEYTELATGSSEDFNKYNIYDMAGNMWEWTTGHNLNSDKTKMFGVARGGGHSGYGTSCPVVRANGGDDLTYYDIFLGFRVVLYINL